MKYHVDMREQRQRNREQLKFYYSVLMVLILFSIFDYVLITPQ